MVTATSSNSIQLSVPSFSISSNTVFLNSSYTPVQSSSIQVGQSVTVWASQDQSGNLKAVQVQQISGSLLLLTTAAKKACQQIMSWIKTIQILSILLLVFHLLCQKLRT